VLKRRHNGATQMGNGVICGPFSRQLHANNKMRAEREKSEQILRERWRETLFAWYEYLSACHFHFPSPGDAHSAKNNVSLTREKDVVRRRALHIFFGRITMRNLSFSRAAHQSPRLECVTRILRNYRECSQFFRGRQEGNAEKMRMPTSAFSSS
jgi:hypothetical protein